jgi:Zn finger protein HypA/HybF involved in hydrogenase expression
MTRPDVQDNEDPFAPADEPRRNSLLHRVLPPELILMLIVLCTWIGGMWFLQKTHPLVAYLLIACLLVARGVQWITLRRATRKLYRDVESAGFRRCVFCRHDLSGLADAGDCPECGAEYALPTLERTWKVIAEVPSRWDDEDFEPLGHWRRLRAIPSSVIYTGLAIFIVCALLLIVRSVGGTTGHRNLLVLLVAVVPLLVWAAATLAERDDMAFIARSRFRVCPRCHLSLPRRKSEGVCPNCRLIWDEKWLQQTWQRVYTEKEAPPGPG